MVELWIGIALLTLLAICFVFIPFFRARRIQQIELADDADRREQNIAIFQERDDELKKEFEAGNLTEEDYQQLRTELQRNLLNDAEAENETAGSFTLGTPQLVTVTLMALMIPAAAFGLYSKYGSAPALQVAIEREASDPFDGRTPTMEEAIAKLEQELETFPENAEGWYLLGNTYMNINRFSDAADAFSNVIRYLPSQAPQRASVMGQRAQALFFANQGVLSDQARDQIKDALSLDPNEITSLGLLGINAFEHQDYQAALEYWQQALTVADGNAAESLTSGVAKAKAELAKQGVVFEEDAAEQVELKLELSIDEALASGISDKAVVFVLARPEGTNMPLAVIRMPYSEFRSSVVLDDSTVMVPGASLAGQPALEVVARVSNSGQPQPQAGDLYGLVGQINAEEQQEVVSLLINRVVE